MKQQHALALQPNPDVDASVSGNEPSFSNLPAMDSHAEKTAVGAYA
jgi:hypothetical protein